MHAAAIYAYVNMQATSDEQEDMMIHLDEHNACLQGHGTAVGASPTGWSQH